MKNLTLKYSTYKELKTQIQARSKMNGEKLTLERLLYKVAKSLSEQHKVEWLTLDNILYIITSLLNKKITDEWIDELANAMKVIGEHGYCEIKERTIGYFTKSICIKVLK